MESIIFEILPPPATWIEEKVDKWSLDVCDMLRREGLLSITIPEVVEETREGDRSVAFIPKIDNMHFAGLLKKHVSGLVVIPNKICVRLTKHQFAEWVEHVYKKGIRHLVIVGGEHSQISHPGYSVLEATRFVKLHYPEMKVGGITIFTRKREAQRIMEKMKAGMDFFFSQVIYEAANMKQIMLTLSKLCKVEGLPMPRIYISLALASKIRDIEFMKLLGIIFPTAVFSYLTEEQEETVEHRSLQAVDMLLDEIFYFMKKEKFEFGFNIEHVMYTNLHLSEKLFKDIKNRIAQE